MTTLNFPCLHFGEQTWAVCRPVVFSTQNSGPVTSGFTSKNTPMVSRVSGKVGVINVHSFSVRRVTDEISIPVDVSILH